jgi:hypothetical protein
MTPTTLTGWIPALTTDGWLLFATYSLRLAAYGLVASRQRWKKEGGVVSKRQV